MGVSEGLDDIVEEHVSYRLLGVSLPVSIS